MKSVLLLAALCFAGCTTSIDRRQVVGDIFPSVEGTSLDGKTWNLPRDLGGKNSLLLIGYEQETQFDIDRWLIGIDQKGYQVDILEVPTIRGWAPRLFSGAIDDGMRSGIPQEIWKIVVTVYGDANKIVSFTGNKNPINARVVVLDGAGYVKFMHDEGFSVSALNKLSEFFPVKSPSK